LQDAFLLATNVPLVKIVAVYKAHCYHVALKIHKSSDHRKPHHPAIIFDKLLPPGVYSLSISYLFFYNP
jgi:hypothetical protein